MKKLTFRETQDPLLEIYCGNNAEKNPTWLTAAFQKLKTNFLKALDEEENSGSIEKISRVLFFDSVEKNLPCSYVVVYLKRSRGLHLPKTGDIADNRLHSAKVDSVKNPGLSQKNGEHAAGCRCKEKFDSVKNPAQKNGEFVDDPHSKIFLRGGRFKKGKKTKPQTDKRAVEKRKSDQKKWDDKRRPKKAAAYKKALCNHEDFDERRYTRFPDGKKIPLKPLRMCEFCHALLQSEYSKKRSICCAKGEVEILEIEVPPEPLLSLETGTDRRSKLFRANSIRINGSLAYTSTGFGTKKHREEARKKLPGNKAFQPCYTVQGEVKHLIGSLEPASGQNEEFCQVLFSDKENRGKRLWAWTKKVRSENSDDELSDSEGSDAESDAESDHEMAIILEDLAQMQEQKNFFDKQFRRIVEPHEAGDIDNWEIRLWAEKKRSTCTIKKSNLVATTLLLLCGGTCKRV